MNLATPKRRWLQFRLRTLLFAVTFSALALGWWRHRQFCLTKANFHEDMEAIYRLRGSIASYREKTDGGLAALYSGWKAEEEHFENLADRHGNTGKAFRAAVFRPWLRLAIHEPE